MVAVNPPGQRIPRKLLDDPELSQFFVEQQEFFFKLWLRTGGGDDGIEGVENEEAFEPGIQTFDQDDLETEIDELSLIPLSFDPTELENADVNDRRYSLLVT